MTTTNICHTNQMVIRYLLFITMSLFVADFAANIMEQALIRDGNEEILRHGPP